MSSGPKPAACMNGRPRSLELGAGAISLTTAAGSLWIGPGAPGPVTQGGFMSVLDVAGSYYDAWISGKGDFSAVPLAPDRSEEHTSELQSHLNLVCRLLLEKKKIKIYTKIRSNPEAR